jgi:hypothetical protein
MASTLSRSRRPLCTHSAVEYAVYHGSQRTEKIMANSDGAAAAEYSVRAQFDDLCRRLGEQQPGQRLEKPLGYWALAGDRRLPYALLEKRVREIIQTPFSELSHTPGIGKKKMAALVMLLERVLRDNASPVAEPKPESNAAAENFAWENVAESHWELWRRTVRTHQLQSIPLGRFAASLQSIPSVIWAAPFATYLDLSLSEMQDMKAHGDKRVRGVVEIFYHIHRALGQSPPARHLHVTLRPAFTVSIELWFLEMLSHEEVPDLQDLRQHVALPILNQIELDGGETIGRLAAGRLGIESPPESVIEQAERLQVTRARIYQLLDVCADVMAVRWPEGRWLLALLSQRLAELDETNPGREMVRTLQALLFPTRSRPTSVQPSLASAADSTEIERAEAHLVGTRDELP